MAKNSHLGQKKQPKIPSVILRMDFKLNRDVFFITTKCTNNNSL